MCQLQKYENTDLPICHFPLNLNFMAYQQYFKIKSDLFIKQVYILKKCGHVSLLNV